MTLRKFSKLLVVGAASLSLGLAIPPTIGVATAIGTFILNSTEVEGNANLFDGSRIRTDRASSKVYLTSGAALVLGVNSSGTIFKDHFTLDQGATKVDNLTGYAIKADDYDIRQGTPQSQAIVRITGKTIEIAALHGPLDVFGEGGALLTRVGAGTATAFQSGGGRLRRMPSGASVDSNNNRKRRVAALYLAAGAGLAGLGIATDAILQSPSTSP